MNSVSEAVQEGISLGGPSLRQREVGRDSESGEKIQCLYSDRE